MALGFLAQLESAAQHFLCEITIEVRLKNHDGVDIKGSS
jgi:hypothetical protein